MSDRSELLDQLKIDRSEPETRGIGTVGFLVTAAIALVVGGAVGFFLAGNGTDDTPVVNQASTPSRGATVATDTGSSSSESEAAPAPPPDNRILNASGYITARQIATVSSQITGLITEVRIEEGMVVEAGQVLARLDDELASVDLEFARAQLASQHAVVASVQANFEEAERALERAERLRPRGLVSEAELTETEARLDALTADLERARADIAVLELEVERQSERLEDHTITAPFAGVVTVKNAQTGEIVSPGSAGGGFTRTGICTIVDMNSLEIEVDVNESFIGRVFADQRVVANLDAYPDWDIPAAVIAIIPTADRAKATVKVRIGIEERDPRILPDMGVKVAFLRD